MDLLEEFVLLAHDDRGARIIDSGRIDHGLGGAILMELALARRIDVADRKVVVSAGDPVGIPAADEALDRIAGDARPRKAVHWVSRFARGTQKRVLHDLVAAEVLRVEQTPMLLVFTRTRYPAVAGPEAPARTDARQRVHSAVTRPDPITPRTAALCALVAATGMEHGLLPDLDRKRVRARLAEISEGDWAAAAVRRAIQDVQAAVTAAAVMSYGDGSAGGDGGGGGGDGGGGGGS
ncbi:MULTISPECIES: GPP34 family phosphoprotein [Actinoplanes]|uniref:GOLPH3/VPS74 family protein n=1 Tax=Actinoplanes TaxID=1865 RepID=UPI0005F2E3E6|nr:MULTISPECIES: GPP34 family phosphoprotein [Actinoplanes]GLY07267.1 GPP34 family phosphoprotein [Actinoplanes sp. NBRC 101535]